MAKKLVEALYKKKMQADKEALDADFYSKDEVKPADQYSMSREDQQAISGSLSNMRKAMSEAEYNQFKKMSDEERKKFAEEWFRKRSNRGE